MYYIKRKCCCGGSGLMYDMASQKMEMCLHCKGTGTQVIETECKCKYCGEPIEGGYFCKSCGDAFEATEIMKKTMKNMRTKL